MKLPLKQLSIGVMLISVLAGCENKNNSANSQNNETNKTAPQDTSKKVQNQSTSSTEQPQAQVVNHKFDIKSNGDEDMPKSKISVTVNGKKHSITEMYCPAKEIGINEFERMGIPKNAVSACGGWWAGAGEYAYMILSNNTLEVYLGWQDETQTDAGFHWEKEKTITL
jgi:hypothetical protein